MVNYPRVTEIITSIFGANPYWTDRGRDKGNALHAAINLDVQGILNYDTIDPEIANRFNAYKRFMLETGAEVVQIWKPEIKLISKQWGFQGTPDAIILVNNSATLIDWKSGVEKSVDFQLALYSILLEHSRNIKIRKAWAVELKDNGNYSIRAVENLNKARRQCPHLLTVHNIKKEYGYISNLKLERS